MKYELYVLDTECTGLSYIEHDVIEISIIRVSTGEQKTWALRPLNENSIQQGALKVNGHKLEDLKHLTKYGRETYLDPNKVIVDIENWLAQDDLPAENRCLIAHNARFDYCMLEQLWTKCNSLETFPWGRRYVDTMAIQFFFDFCKEEMLDSYSLNSLGKVYGVKNDKSHTAASDTLCTKEIFMKQVDLFKKLMK